TIQPDEPDILSPLDLERGVTKSPEFFRVGFPGKKATHSLSNHAPGRLIGSLALMSQPIDLSKVFGKDGSFCAHMMSANERSILRKKKRPARRRMAVKVALIEIDCTLT